MRTQYLLGFAMWGIPLAGDLESFLEDKLKTQMK